MAILAGGASTRMGADKALLPWQGGELIDHVIGIAHMVVGAGSTMVVGDRPAYYGRGALVIADDYRDTGPLGGIATALGHWSGDRLLVVAVDMPMLSVDLLSTMVERNFDGDALVPRTPQRRPSQHERLRPEALHSIYRVRCLDAIRRSISGGRLKVADVFENLDVEYLDPEWLRMYDPDLRSFENANTPEAFGALKEDFEDAE